MDQTKDSESRTPISLMGAVDGITHHEWLEHPCTKLLLKRIRDDIRTGETMILEKAKTETEPKSVLIGAIGAQCASLEGVIALATERFDG